MLKFGFSPLISLESHYQWSLCISISSPLSSPFSHHSCPHLFFASSSLCYSSPRETDPVLTLPLTQQHTTITYSRCVCMREHRRQNFCKHRKWMQCSTSFPKPKNIRHTHTSGRSLVVGLCWECNLLTQIFNSLLSSINHWSHTHTDLEWKTY